MILADRISKKYGNSKDALREVSFSIENGEIVGIIGANGSGKTTLLKTIAGIVQPTSGRLWVMENRTFDLLKGNKKSIGAMLGVNSQLINELTVRDSLELCRAMYRISKVNYKDMMNNVGNILSVNEFLDKNISELSLGQRTRAEFLYAILPMPHLLILDEPTIGVDSNTRQAIIKTIRWLNRENSMTILVSSHDLNLIESVARRVILLDNGIIKYDGMLNKIKSLYATICYMKVKTDKPILDFQDFPITFYEYDNDMTTICFDSKIISKNTILKFIFSQANVLDIQIIEPTIENILNNLYRSN